MLAAFLKTKYQHSLEEGWGALELGNLPKAEEHFQEVLSNEDDPKITALEIVDAHSGLGALSVKHKDFFDATRWYQEGKYILDRHYGSAWPKVLDWAKFEDRPAMRTLVGLGHLAYERGDLKGAMRIYEDILDRDKHDGLGIKRYCDAAKEGKKFEEA